MNSNSIQGEDKWCEKTGCPDYVQVWFDINGESVVYSFFRLYSYFSYHLALH